MTYRDATEKAEQAMDRGQNVGKNSREERAKIENSGKIGKQKRPLRMIETRSYTA